MNPQIWFLDTYSLCMIVGISVSFYAFNFLATKKGFQKNYIYDILILACLTVAFGILSAMLFQFIFNLIDGLKKFGAMTFYGGLIGGAAFFILGYFFYIQKHYKNKSFIDILIITPVCITLAHAFGRLGCYAAGCCYGIETTSPFGLMFPGHDTRVLPTQLYESLFLFILSYVLFYLENKYHFKYTMPIYMASYGIWRFFIEFLRGDERGSFIPGISPAQAISILLIIGAGVLFYFLYKGYLDDKNDTGLE